MTQTHEQDLTQTAEPVWPRVRFDPVRLFDLHVGDLMMLDPYFVRLSMPGFEASGDAFFVGLAHAPEVVGYFCDLCPDRAEWLREGVGRVAAQSEEAVRSAETAVLRSGIAWNLGMAKSPETWDAMPWGSWPPSVIYDRIHLAGKLVLDVGAGTGQVSLRCAPFAREVIAMEPVARLRRYIERKMGAAGLHNVRTLHGILAEIPLPDGSVDALILSNGSFGWSPDQELREMERVVRPGGTILMLGPCNFGNEPILSAIRGAGGYEEFAFEVPCDGMKPAFIKTRA